MNLYAINFIFFKNSEFKVYCFSSLKYTTKYDKVGEHYQWLLGKWEEERKPTRITGKYCMSYQDTFSEAIMQAPARSQSTEAPLFRADPLG